jgi:hypothetical protein
MSVIQDWATLREDGPTLEDLEDNLYIIYLEAVDFSQLLRRQRASWSVKFPKRVPIIKDDVEKYGDLSVDPSSMAGVLEYDEDRDPEELLHQFVELVVTPALSKRGTAGGNQFDAEYIVTKASIMIFEETK